MNALLYIMFWIAGIVAAVTGLLALIGYGSTWRIEVRFLSEEEFLRIQ